MLIAFIWQFRSIFYSGRPLPLYQVYISASVIQNNLDNLDASACKIQDTAQAKKVLFRA